MTAITIRNVPDELRDELVARAERRGLSLEQYLLWGLENMIEESGPDDDESYEEWLDGVRARARETGADLTIEQILADRDADRR